MKKKFTFHLRELTILLLLLFVASSTLKAQRVIKLTFEGTISEKKLALKDLKPALPSDWTSYTHLVWEMRTSSPQRFSIWLYRTNGTPVRIMMQPFGQNVWSRASLPVKFFVGKDDFGTDLASANNRRTNSYWYSIWGPFGEINSIEAIAFAMEYPINNPTIEIRAMHLSKQDEGSDFLKNCRFWTSLISGHMLTGPEKLKAKNN